MGLENRHTVIMSMLCIFNLAHLVRRYNRKKGIKCFCFYFIQAKGVQESVLLSLLHKTSVVGNVDWNKNSVFFASPPRRTRLQWTMHTWMSASASWLSSFFHSKCTAMHQYVLILLQCTSQYLAALCPCRYLFLPKFPPSAPPLPLHP